MSLWFNIGSFVSLLFLLGATIMTFFLILSGARNTGILKNFYWIEATTAGFNDASNMTRWFNYEFCGYSNGQLFNCSSKAPAKPFSPKDNFGSNPLMPTSFLNDRDAYYYLSRVGWAMLLIAVFCEVMTLIPQIITVFKHIRSLSILLLFSIGYHYFSFFRLHVCLLVVMQRVSGLFIPRIDMLSWVQNVLLYYGPQSFFFFAQVFGWQQQRF